MCFMRRHFFFIIILLLFKLGSDLQAEVLQLVGKMFTIVALQVRQRRHLWTNSVRMYQGCEVKKSTDSIFF